MRHDVLRVLFSPEGSSSIMTGDAIAFQGGIWLVPEWLENLAEGWRRPTRLIRVDLLNHQKNVFHHDLVLKVPVPKDALDGRTTGLCAVLDGSLLDLKFVLPQVH